jgi:hypothetical protein
MHERHHDEYSSDEESHEEFKEESHSSLDSFKQEFYEQ